MGSFKRINMKFNLETKTYKDEIYRADLGQGISAVVKMVYHTHLKFWTVIYKIAYPPYYQTEQLFGKDYIYSRKEARSIAQQVMDSAKPDDWKTKLSPFYQNLIREAIAKSSTPSFMNL